MHVANGTCNSCVFKSPTRTNEGSVESKVVVLKLAIFTFPDERRMLMKERASGMYRLSSYFMVYMTADLPMDLVLPTIYMIKTYWMGGLSPSAFRFFITLFSILFFFPAVEDLGVMLGAVLMDVKTASTLTSRHHAHLHDGSRVLFSANGCFSHGSSTSP
ncbi:hypothetical protein EJ110_NYTH01007 [Nymphaea thermarum]|nr:hypothetical protein EJ110_NYTH01007 [Nymphaea thermarum]